MTIFFVFGLSPSFATGMYLGELSVSTSTEASEGSSSLSSFLPLFLLFILFYYINNY